MYSLFININFTHLHISRYATVKKDSEKPEAPIRRRKRSTKSLSVPSSTKPDPIKHQFVDAAYPDRSTRTQHIFAPKRPPRRTSSSSLIEQQK